MRESGRLRKSWLNSPPIGRAPRGRSTLKVGEMMSSLCALSHGIATSDQEIRALACFPLAFSEPRHARDCFLRADRVSSSPTTISTHALNRFAHNSLHQKAYNLRRVWESHRFWFLSGGLPATRGSTEREREAHQFPWNLNTSRIRNPERQNIHHV